MKIKKPPRSILKLPLHVRAEMAMKAAVKEAIAEHARQGRPIYVWRDGKVVEIPARELRKRYRRAAPDPKRAS
jgi:hypothetical protein